MPSASNLPRSSARNSRRLRLLTVAVHFALGFPYAASSQPLQPIYPSYEGYTTNADGTHTLVFSYYSANLLTVELEPGPANGFLPQPEDRGQPVTCHPS